MREEQLKAMRKTLLNLRENLLSEVRRRHQEAASLGDEGVPDPGDSGVTDNLKELLNLLSDSKREEIMKIDEALLRMDEGSYGVCQDCGEAVGKERLELQPYTRFCIDCKKEQEAEEQRRAGPGRGTL